MIFLEAPLFSMKSLSLFFAITNVFAVCDSAFAVCDRTLATGTSLTASLATATPGMTICLSPGNWGSISFSGITKANFVTIQSLSGVTAVLSPQVTGGTQYLRFANLTIPGMSIDGANTKHIAVANSVFTQKLDIVTTNFNANDILVDSNTFSGINANGGAEGRVSVHWPNGPGSVPAGVVISNNMFNGNGCSDGVQLGSYGVVVGPGNTFTNLTQGNCTEHVDAIQGYGQSHSVIRGNYFLRPRVCLGFYDSGDSEIFEDNIFIGNGVDGTQCVIDLGSLVNAKFNHNTVVGASPRVGGINFSPGGSGTYSENILLNSSFVGEPLSSCTACVFTHNLTSAPTFLGGATPAAWAGWQLAPTSAGYKAGLDGKDQGTTFYGTVKPPLSPTLSAPKNLRAVGK